MVVVMEERATETQIEQVVARLVEMGMDVHRSTGVSRTVLGVVGQKRPDPGLIEMLDGVHEVMRISEPYKLASKTFKPEGTVVTIGDVRIGGDEVVVMAGPCSAETDAQVRASAAAVRKAGAKIQGRRVQTAQFAIALGPGGGRSQDAARCSRGREPELVTEVMDANQIEVIGKYATSTRWARNMQNFTLLRELGYVRKPVPPQRHRGDDRRVAAFGGASERRQ